MALVCDTAVLIAAERESRLIGPLARRAAQTGVELVVPTCCIAQAWRDALRQVKLVRFLKGCEERPLDSRAARRVGELLAITGTSDVVDATVAVSARSGDVVLTGDPDDLRRLVDAAPAEDVRVEAFG